MTMDQISAVRIRGRGWFSAPVRPSPADMGDGVLWVTTIRYSDDRDSLDDFPGPHVVVYHDGKDAQPEFVRRFPWHMVDEFMLTTDA